MFDTERKETINSNTITELARGRMRETAERQGSLNNLNIQKAAESVGDT